MGICFIIGVLIAYLVFAKTINKEEAEKFFDYSPFAILFSLIGARLFYVFGSYEYYFSNPKEIIMLNHGGLSIFGAIIFGIISLYALSKRYKFDFLTHCDILAVVFPLCQALGRFGNYFNQEAYGLPCDSFLCLYVDKKFRVDDYINVDYFHPTFLYESMFDVVIFIILLSLYLKNKKFKKGSIFLLYLILYSIVRFFIESIRIDSVLNIFNLHIAQVISLIILMFSIVFLYFINKKSAD